MRRHAMIFVIPVALFCVGSTSRIVVADEAKKAENAEKASSETTADPQKTQRAVGRALEFMVQDAEKWCASKGCATCHHGTMTVWALNEATSRGYAVDAKVLAEVTRWTKDQFLPRINKPRDSRPGWNLVSVPAVYLGLMSQNLPVLSRDELHQIASHLGRHQEEDGTWMLPPGGNGVLPTWESSETLALLAYLAWEPSTPSDPAEAANLRAGREKIADWLSQSTPTDTTQSTALRLLFDVRGGKSATELQPQIERIFSRQNSDGGWSQLADLSSDAYATGQSLWALSFAGVDSHRDEIRRAVAFLVSTQRDDGSWPMVSRNHPGIKSTRNPIRNPMPITYFGTSWGTLGLLRSVTPLLDLAARQKLATEAILRYSGTIEKDDKDTEKPVIGVKVPWEVDNEELASLVEHLTAFPQLASLQLKSTHLQDSGLAPLKRLSQLRKLSLEIEAMTDAGLAKLQALTYLEELNVKGTKVTDAGVEDFKKALPKAKIER